MKPAVGERREMRRHAELIIRKILQKSNAEIAFASLFGSYRRGDYDAFSDVDLLVVYSEEKEKPSILSGLKRLERMLDRRIHMNLFNLKEFERRLRFHDYLITSIIEDSSFIFGRKDIFDKAKRNILEVHPDEESIRFNRQMGFEILERVYSYFNDLNSNSFHHYGDPLNCLARGLNDYRLALGYLYANAQMQRSGGGISSTHPVQSRFNSTLKELAHIERLIKRGSKIDYMTLRKLVDEIKNGALRILTLKQDSLSRLTPLIESYRLKLLWIKTAFLHRAVS